MDEHWTDRLVAECEAQDLKLDALDRAAGLPVGRARTYKNKRSDQPRGDALPRYARALGVELLWLRDGVEPRRAGELAVPAPGESGDDILHRRQVAERIAGARVRRQIASPELAALGTIISGRRWRQIEAGGVSPTPLELQAISERLWSSLDWLVSGHVTPIDEYDPVQTEKVRRALHEEAVKRLPAPR